MSPFIRVLALLLLVSLLATTCGGAEPTTTPVPATATRIAFEVTEISTPARDTATALPPTPTQTPVQPTATAVPPTATSVPPTDTLTPSPVSTPDQLDIADVLSKLEGLPIGQFMRESFRQLQLRDPDSLVANGFADIYGLTPSNRFTDLSAAYVRDTQQLERELLNLLRSYDRSALSAEEKISYESLEWYLDTQVRGQAYTDYKVLVNPVWGLQNWPIDILTEHPLENRQDVENYIARLSGLGIWADQVIAVLERNERVGAIPLRYVLEDTIAQLDQFLEVQGNDPPAANRLEVYADFRSRIHRIDSLGAEEKTAFMDSVLTEIEETLIPAYQALKAQLVHLMTLAVDDPDQWKLPGGEEYYAYLLEYYTGTNLSADEIHAWGLAEVDRIQAEIQSAAVDAGYPAGISITELNKRLPEDSPIVTGEALRRKYEEILTAADQAAREYFDLRTSADVTIQKVKGGPPAYYAPPEPGSDGSGTMPVNLDFSPLYVDYNEYVLVHHETIPGHHTQIALAQELDLPGYQRFYSVNPYLQNYAFQAYAEGWALYAEILAWEMGLYEGEPLANLGRLRLRLLRAVRPVVDTGIHAKGWTLDEAAAYLEDVTGQPQSRTRLTRYLVNPGYPCGYSVGGLKILEMRQRAREELGDAFDIREFHNAVLGHGVLPIGVLENALDDWIAEELHRAALADSLAALQGLPIDEFFERYYRQLQLRDLDAVVVNQLTDEYGVPNDRFTDMSENYVHETQQLEPGILDLLRTYDRGALTLEQQLSYDVYEWVLKINEFHDLLLGSGPLPLESLARVVDDWIAARAS